MFPSLNIHSPEPRGSTTSTSRILVGIDVGPKTTGVSYTVLGSDDTGIMLPCIIDQWPGQHPGLKRISSQGDWLPDGAFCESEAQVFGQDLISELFIGRTFSNESSPEDYTTHLRSICDFLEGLRGGITTFLVRNVTGFSKYRTPVKFLFSVPFSWGPEEISNFEGCVNRAGYGCAEHHSVEIAVTDAHAAAIYSFFSANSDGRLPRELGDLVLVCDVTRGIINTSVLHSTSLISDRGGIPWLEEFRLVEAQRGVAGIWNSPAGIAISHDILNRRFFWPKSLVEDVLSPAVFMDTQVQTIGSVIKRQLSALVGIVEDSALRMTSIILVGEGASELMRKALEESLATNVVMASTHLQNGATLGLVLHAHARLLYDDHPVRADNPPGTLSSDRRISVTSDTTVRPSSIPDTTDLNNSSQITTLDPSVHPTLTLDLGILEELGGPLNDPDPVTAIPGSDDGDDLSLYQTDTNDYTTERDGALGRLGRLASATVTSFTTFSSGDYFTERDSVLMNRLRVVKVIAKLKRGVERVR